MSSAAASCDIARTGGVFCDDPITPDVEIECTFTVKPHSIPQNFGVPSAKWAENALDARK